MSAQPEFKAGVVEVTIFKVPSGDVRGVVYAAMGKDRVAHAYLHVTEPPKITLDKVKGKPTLTEVRQVADLLIRFADTVEKS